MQAKSRTLMLSAGSTYVETPIKLRFPSVRTNQVALNEEERWSEREAETAAEAKSPFKVIKYTKLTSQTLRIQFKINKNRKRRQISAGNKPARFRNFLEAAHIFTF